ncbi:MAG: ABC transporter permease [bacterium]
MAGQAEIRVSLGAGRRHGAGPSWAGDVPFLLWSLAAKDFKVRYRNMSLGVFWSVLNPLVMMGVLTFIFTQIFPNHSIPNFALFVLCGLVPYNFFVVAWLAGTMSLVDNAALIKRTPVPREVIPLAAVLSNAIHLLIQIALLFGLVIAAGFAPNRYWLWLPYIWAMEIVFVGGLSLVTSALNVAIRDVRYVVESTNTVLFWLVPIFYSFAMIPQQFKEIYQFNPLAALILAMRTILLEGAQPRWELLAKLTVSSVVVFAAGMAVFARLKRRFYDYL